MRRIATVLVIIGLLAALAGAASATPPRPAGKFRTVITKPANFVGPWWLTFGAHNAFAVYRGYVDAPHLGVRGSVSYSGNQITFTDASGPAACTGAQATGVYSYTLPSKTTLRLTKIRDDCVGRRTVLAGRRFTKPAHKKT